ncbi:MAG: hypothetical protein K0V04_39605, partial [Deltaproteobacteria bacterium]|nr:hypothetical protein [Deltaproteobacteria bacterium]
MEPRTHTLAIALLALSAACDTPTGRPGTDDERLDEALPMRDFSCTQLDLMGDGEIGFDDFTVLSANYNGQTDEELPLDFAFFLEFSDRYGEVCDGLLKAPLRYSSMDEILAGRIETIYDVVDRQPWSDEDKEDFFIEEVSVDSLAIDRPVAMPDGSVRFTDLATVDDAWAYAVGYGESHHALQLRWLEAMVEYRMFRASDPVHQALAEAYLEAAADPDGDAFRSGQACQATCNLGYAVAENDVSAKRTTTCNSTTADEPISLDWAQTNCEAGYGWHTEEINGKEWNILGPYGQNGVDIISTDCHQKVDVAMLCSFVGDCDIELCEATVSSSGVT